MSKQEQFVDPEVYPAAASALGINAYHINGCTVIHQCAPYAACLKRIEHYNNGELGKINIPECLRALGGPACEAWRMQAEEREAKQAIYFINRRKVNAARGIIVTAAPERAVSVERPKPTPSHRPKEIVAPKPVVGGYADAINAALQEIDEPEVNQPAQPLVSPAPAEQNLQVKVKPAMLPNETPMEYAKRLIAFAFNSGATTA